MCVQASSCVFVLCAQRQQQLWMSEVVLLVRRSRTQWSHSWTHHGLTLFIVSLVYGTYATNQAAAVRHSCTSVCSSDFFQKNKRQQQNFLSFLICLQQPLHRWQAERPGRASYSIHFSANMICLNGEAYAKTFLCGQTSLNNRGTVFVLRRQIFEIREQRISLSLSKIKG